MKQISKIVTAILLISILVTVGIANQGTIPLEDRKPVNDTITLEDRKPVNDTIPANIAPATVEWDTYNDVWTLTSPNILDLGNFDRTTQIFNEAIYLKYPSTLTVQFSSEVYNRADLTAHIDADVIPPGQIYFNRIDGPTYQTHSFTFAKSYVPAGWHTIRIHGFGNARLWYKSMIITANGYGH